MLERRRDLFALERSIDLSARMFDVSARIRIPKSTSEIMTLCL